MCHMWCRDSLAVTQCSPSKPLTERPLHEVRQFLATVVCGFRVMPWITDIYTFRQYSTTGTNKQQYSYCNVFSNYSILVSPDFTNRPKLIVVTIIPKNSFVYCLSVFRGENLASPSPTILSTNRLMSQIPECTCSIAHNTSLRTGMCTFAYCCKNMNIFAKIGNDGIHMYVRVCMCYTCICVHYLNLSRNDRKRMLSW